MKKKIDHLMDLRELLSAEFYTSIINSCRAGDPEWIMDLIRELDEELQPGAMFYLPEFHGKLIGYKAEDFNLDSINSEAIKLFDQNYAEEQSSKK